MIETQVISADNPTAIEKALTVLRNGGLIAFPTDTVYGLAGDLFSYDSIERIYQAKDRESTKAIPVLVGEVAQLNRVTTEIGAKARRLAETYWPGALTLVVPKHSGLPENLSVLPTVGVRMPDHPFALSLLRVSGPLAVTSANLSGQASPQTAEDVLAQLRGRIELVIDGGRTPGGTPSTVVDCTAEEPVILRVGPISAEAIRRIVS